MRSKYIIQFQNGSRLQNAVSKAPDDISFFLEQSSFENVYIPTMGEMHNVYLYCFTKVRELYHRIQYGSLVVINYPVYSKKGLLILSIVRCLLKIFKQTKFVAIVHDVRFIRGEEILPEKEIRELNRYSAIIVHSDSMIDVLKRNGCKASCIKLGLFDYYVNNGNTVYRSLSSNICFAGNLLKSVFIKDLGLLCEAGLKFHLYGNPSMSFPSSIEYCGSFSPDDVSSLQGSWGLVWDGTSIDSLQGDSGIYQKFNSPHKASLYISAELPLIVSSESALASIVKENELGICVDSLLDLNTAIGNVTKTEYENMLKSVKKWSRLLNRGHNITGAIKKIEAI